MGSIAKTEDELVRLIAAGDSQAFAEIYREHQRKVYRFAFLMSGSDAIAEDITQEVFTILIRNTHQFDPSQGRLSAYLCGIARYIILRHLKRSQIFVPLADEGEEGAKSLLINLTAQNDPLHDYMRDRTVETVRRAVLALPPKYREVVVLCDLQEMSYSEAASAIGCPVSTVGARLFRAHNMLRAKLHRSDLNNENGASLPTQIWRYTS